MAIIETGEGFPEVIVRDNLEKRLTDFAFDAEKYAAGLVLAEISEETIASLRVEFGYHRFTHPDFKSATSADYHQRQHSIKVTTTKGEKFGLSDTNTYTQRELPKGSPWPFPGTLSDTVNYYLGQEASWMADTILERPDYVRQQRTRKLTAGQTGTTMGIAATAGAILGPDVIYGSHNVSTLFANTGGAVLGAMFSGIGAFVYSRPSREDWEANNAAWNRQSMRALEFANSPEAHDIFKDVVKIELIKEK